MTPRNRSQWRTVLTVLVLAVVLLAGFVLALRAGELGAKAFADFSLALVFLAAVQASKSATEHLAGGGGVKGAITALMSPAKPEPPPAEPQP